MSSYDASGAVTGGVRVLLRLEGLAVLTMAVIAYRHSGAGWGLFAALFLLPDIAFLAYLGNPRAGAVVYNALHSYLAPAVLWLTGLLPPVALIWVAHIGFDRAVGYGLKYPSAFGATHLGFKGKPGQ